MKFGIVGNLDKKEVPGILSDLLRNVKNGEMEFLLHEDLAKAARHEKGKTELQGVRALSEQKLLKEAEMLITLGGDGTILRAARMVGEHKIPILGVNLGKLGFLAEVSVEELHACLAEIRQGRYVVEERMMLEATSSRAKNPVVALNDVVVDKYGTSRVMAIETYVNDEYLATYSADGIIISTPTGSTAYSLATGGPIVAPASAVITISPICPHTLTARPVIVPDDSKISVKIVAAANKVHLAADGQQEELFAAPVTISVKKAGFNVRLVKRLDRSYYDVLRKKLNWGSDMRIGSNN